MSDFGYCATWPDALKEAERKRYRLSCKIKCLESALTRIDPYEFDGVMDEIERTQKELRAVAMECLNLRAGMQINPW